PTSLFNAPTHTATHTLSLHDALPISQEKLQLLGNVAGRQADALKPVLVERKTHRRHVIAPIGIDRSHQGTGLHDGTSLLRDVTRSEEHTSELQSLRHLVCRLLLEKKN